MGEFKNRNAALKVLENTIEAIEGVLEYYNHNAVFKKYDKSSKKNAQKPRASS